MICDFYEWRAFLTYVGFKYHVNVIEGLIIFAEERVKVGKEEAFKSNFNQVYDEIQENKDKIVTRQLLDMERKKVHDRISQWELIFSTDSQNTSSKFWTDYFVAVNLHPHHCLSFTDQINNIATAVKMVEMYYSWN